MVICVALSPVCGAGVRRTPVRSHYNLYSTVLFIYGWPYSTLYLQSSIYKKATEYMYSITVVIYYLRLSYICNLSRGTSKLNPQISRNYSESRNIEIQNRFFVHPDIQHACRRRLPIDVAFRDQNTRILYPKLHFPNASQYFLPRAFPTGSSSYSFSYLLLV